MFARWVSGFGNFTAAHGFAVNLVAVIALAAIGAGLLSGQPRLLRPDDRRADRARAWRTGC